MKAYNAILQQPTINPAILSSFTAEGLTREEALTQPRRAEVILRHDPFAPSPYIVTISSPAFAFGEWDVPVHRDQVWDFATFKEARACFKDLFDANEAMISERQRALKREPINGTVQWKVGDSALLSRLMSYDLFLARTQPTPDQIAAPKQSSIARKQYESEDLFQKKRSHPRRSRTAMSTRRDDVPLPTPRPHTTLVTPLSIFGLASNGESFFSFGNC